MSTSKYLASTLGFGLILSLAGCNSQNGITTPSDDLSSARVTAACKPSTIVRTGQVKTNKDGTTTTPTTTTTLTYDASGQLSTLTRSGSQSSNTSQTTFTRSGTLLIVSNKDPKGKTHADTLTLNTGGQVISQRQGGLTRTYSYDAAGFLTKETLSNAKGETVGTVTYVVQNGNIISKTTTINADLAPKRPPFEAWNDKPTDHPLHPDTTGCAGFFGDGPHGHKGGPGGHGGPGGFGFGPGMKGNYIVAYEYSDQANTFGLSLEPLEKLVAGTPSAQLVKTATITNDNGLKTTLSYSYSSDPAKPNTITVTITSTGTDPKGNTQTRTETVTITFSC